MNGIPFLDGQVLVVGAGPTGLVLAAELLARGIGVRIIDKGDGVALQTRAIGIHARTLEVLDMMGLAERFVERGQVVRHLRFYSEGRCLASLEFGRCGSRFGFLLDLPQDQTERLLRARIAELGGMVEDRTELIGLTAGREAVTAVVRSRGGETESITAGYVVGCDGAHSRVRHELGLSFHGHPYPQEWLLADRRWHLKLASQVGSHTVTGRGARWSVSSWISARVGACRFRFPANGSVSRHRWSRIGKKIIGSPSDRKNACAASAGRSQSSRGIPFMRPTLRWPRPQAI